MSMRRPRIKAIANLSLRRKTNEKNKVENVSESDLSEKNCVSVKNDEEKEVILEPNITSENVTQINEKSSQEITEDSNCMVEKSFDIKDSNNSIDDSIFKSPPNYNRTNSVNSVNSSVKQIFTDIVPLSINETNPVKDDLKCPLSPSKVRQRIKPTPFFRQRRNSRDEIEDSPKRQRTSSCSSNVSVMIKSPGNTTTRIRTESSCSNASDASLLKDLPVKRRPPRTEDVKPTSFRHFRNRFTNEKQDKTKLTMLDMIYYNPATNPMKNTGTIKEEKIKSTTSSVQSFPIQKPKSIQNLSIDKREEVPMPVPQLKIGPNGEIIIDEKSLVIETTAEKLAKETLASADVVYEDEFSGFQGFYKRQKRTRDWSSAETMRFYRCLHTIGTDFSMMLTLFPNRTRRDLKLKFKREERCNPDLINKALLNPKLFNIEELENEFQQEEEEAKKELQKQKKIHEGRVEERKKSLNKIKRSIPQRYLSKTLRALTDGDYVYENEFNLQKKNMKKKKSNKNIKNNTTNTTAEQSHPNLPVESVILDKFVAENEKLNRYEPNLSVESNKSIDIDVNQTSNSITDDSYSNKFDTITSTCGKNYFTNVSNIQIKEKELKLIDKMEDNTENDVNETDCVEKSNKNPVENVNDTLEKESEDNRSNSQSSNSPSSPENFENSNFSTSVDLVSLDLNNLVAIALEDNENPDKVIHEIYRMCPITGELTEKVDLPERIVKAIADIS